MKYNVGKYSFNLYSLSQLSNQFWYPLKLFKKTYVIYLFPLKYTSLFFSTTTCDQLFFFSILTSLMEKLNQIKCYDNKIPNGEPCVAPLIRWLRSMKFNYWLKIFIKMEQRYIRLINVPQ